MGPLLMVRVEDECFTELIEGSFREFQLRVQVRALQGLGQHLEEGFGHSRFVRRVGDFIVRGGLLSSRVASRTRAICDHLDFLSDLIRVAILLAVQLDLHMARGRRK